MKLALPFLLLPLAGCGISDKVTEAKASIATAQAEYDSFDLSCDFSDVSGQTEAQASAGGGTSLTDSSCSNASEQYAVMVEEFDTDGDGALNDTELAEAEDGWKSAQTTELDKDGDGAVSDTEKVDFRANKLPQRQEKLAPRFKEACSNIGKQEADCKDLRKNDGKRLKETLEGRIAEFDKDGDKKLNADERKAMEATLATERKQRQETVKKQNDADGDGKVNDTERTKRRDQRNQAKPPRPGATAATPTAAAPTPGAVKPAAAAAGKGSASGSGSQQPAK